MQFAEIAGIMREKFPEIATNISKLTEDSALRQNLSQAGTIGALINLGFLIFDKITSNLKSQEELAFGSFVKVTFQCTMDSLPDNLKNLSLKNAKSQIDMQEILNLFSSNYTSHIYYLPDHPAAKRFRDKIINLMKKDTDANNQEIYNFIISFNSNILIRAKHSNLERLLTEWKIKTNDRKLLGYLAYVSSLLDEPNPVDEKSVSEYYIENDMLKIEKESWDFPIDHIHRFEHSNWKIDHFIKDDKKKREFVAAEFGTGKTNLAKKIAVDYAKK